MSDKKVLLDAAALLVKLAGGPETKPDPKLDEIVAVWMKLIEQFENDEKPHEWRELKPGTPYWEVGNNEKESPFYEKFKSFWMAMERQRVPDQSGRPFVYQESVRRGGNPEFEASVKFLAKTSQGRAWFNDPLNANYLPKSQDMLLLN